GSAAGGVRSVRAIICSGMKGDCHGRVVPAMTMFASGDGLQMREAEKSDSRNGRSLFMRTGQIDRDTRVARRTDIADAADAEIVLGAFYTREDTAFIRRRAEHFMRLFHRQPGAAVIRGFEHTGDGEFFRKLLRRCADLDDMLDRLEALAINGGAVARFRCELRVERLDDPQAIVNVAHDDLTPRTGGT